MMTNLLMLQNQNQEQIQDSVNHQMMTINQFILLKLHQVERVPFHLAMMNLQMLQNQNPNQEQIQDSVNLQVIATNQYTLHKLHQVVRVLSHSMKNQQLIDQNQDRIQNSKNQVLVLKKLLQQLDVIIVLSKIINLPLVPPSLILMMIILSINHTTLHKLLQVVRIVFHQVLDAQKLVLLLTLVEEEIMKVIISKVPTLLKRIIMNHTSHIMHHKLHQVVRILFLQVMMIQIIHQIILPLHHSVVEEEIIMLIILRVLLDLIINFLKY